MQLLGPEALAEDREQPPDEKVAMTQRAAMTRWFATQELETEQH